MKRKMGARRNRAAGDDNPAVFSKSASLLSVNGKLRSLYYEPKEEEQRSEGYTAVSLGKPIVVRYLSNFLRLDNARDNDQEIMISTFVKTEEEKKAAAECVNYYNAKTKFNDGVAEDIKFGADVYGHELIYYSKSYIGEPLKLTTKIMELDNPEKSVKEITEGIDSVAGIPFFVEYLPYIAIAKSGVSLLANIFKILDRDDPIVPGLPLNLFYNRPNSPRLQSGRIVNIQGRDEEQILESGISLNNKNKLINADGSAYTESSYYVVQINSERQPSYESFEYFQNAAELLALTNRPDGLTDFIKTAAEGFKTYADISTINDMEGLRDELDDQESLDKFKAMFKGLSGDVRNLYREKYRDILAEQ